MSDLTPGDIDPMSVQKPLADPGAPPPVVAGNDSIGGRLRDLVMHPGRLMARVGARPQWWVPGLIVMVVVAAFSWLTAPISGPEQMEMMRDSKLMSMMPEDQWQAQYDAAMNPTMAKRITQAITAGLTAWIMMLIFGFALGFFVRMNGGKGTFKQALAVTSWAGLLPFALGPVIKAPLIMATESVFRVNLGLAALMPGGDPGSPVFQTLMAYGDFLTWWGLAVMVIGFSVVFGLTRKAAVTAVVLPWALLSLIPLGLSLLFM